MADNEVLPSSASAGNQSNQRFVTRNRNDNGRSIIKLGKDYLEYQGGRNDNRKDSFGGNIDDALFRLNSIAKTEILHTVNYMEFRKYNRTFRGQHRPLSRSRVSIVFLLLVFLVGYLDISYCNDNIIVGVKAPVVLTQRGLEAFAGFIMSMALVVALLVLAKTQTSQSLRWSLYVSYFFFIVIVAGFVTNIFSGNFICKLPESTSRMNDALGRHTSPVDFEAAQSTDSTENSLERHPRILMSHQSSDIERGGPTLRATTRLRSGESNLYGMTEDIKSTPRDSSNLNWRYDKNYSTFNQMESFSNQTIQKQTALDPEEGLLRNEPNETQQSSNTSGEKNAILSTVVNSGRIIVMTSSAQILWAYIWLQTAIIIATVFFIYLYPKCVRDGWTSCLRPWKVVAFQRRPVIVPLLPSDKLPDLDKAVDGERLPYDVSKSTEATLIDQYGYPGRDRYHIWSSGYFVHVRYRRFIGRIWNLLCCIPCLGSGSPHKRRWKSNLYGHSGFYVGEVDSLGRPHGCGKWIEETYYGEILSGYWKNGRPVGPFKSKEFGSGSSFCCVRIAYAQLLNKGKIDWGVADVECSVSGAFFRGYPQVNVESVEALDITFAKKKNLKKGTLSTLPLTSTSDPNLRSFLGTIASTGFPVCNHLCCMNVAAVLNELKRYGHVPKFTFTPRTSVMVGIDANGELYVSEHTSIEPKKKTTNVAEYVAPSSSSVSIRIIPPVTHLEQRSINLKTRSVTEHLLGSTLSVDSTALSGDAKSSNDEFSSERTPILVASGMPELRVDGWVPLEETNQPEIAIFIHGYNCQLKYALGNFGQLISMCNLPSHIRPIVFSWPGGNHPLMFPMSRKRAMKSDISDRFSLFLVSLGCLGIRRIHVIAHSMGARVALGGLVKAFDSGLFASLRVTSDQLSDAKPSLDQPNEFSSKSVPYAEIASCSKHETLDTPLELATCTLLNPEYELNAFVSDVFEKLRAHCPLISVYSDANDKALWWGEKYTRKHSLGRNVFGLRRDANFSLPTPHDFLHMIAHPTYEHRRDDLSEMPVRLPIQSALLRFARLTSGCKYLEEEEENSDDDVSAHESSILIKAGTEHDQFSNEMKQHSADSLTDNVDTTLQSFPSIIAEGPGIPQVDDIKIPIIKSDVLNRTDALMEFPDIGIAAEWLDVDVIDTTYVENNVHAMRHTFYNVNREIIDDIADILIYKRRAHYRRARLDHREGNVWVFKVAPSYLGSLYG